MPKTNVTIITVCVLMGIVGGVYVHASTVDQPKTIARASGITAKNELKIAPIDPNQEARNEIIAEQKEWDQKNQPQIAEGGAETITVLKKESVLQVYTASEETSNESIQAYINTYFPNSPITVEMIQRVAKHYHMPVGFILAVGHNESHMGTKGRAVQTMNPMNVGNTDAGDYKQVICGVANNCLSGWEEGLNLFAKLIKDCYFSDGESIKLQTWIDRDFRAVRCGLEGKRYMTDWRAAGKYQERINNLNKFNIQY